MRNNLKSSYTKFILLTSFESQHKFSLLSFNIFKLVLFIIFLIQIKYFTPSLFFCFKSSSLLSFLKSISINHLSSDISIKENGGIYFS